MVKSTFVIVKTTFEALHNWSTCCIDKVKFLKNSHRHIFGVVTEVQVTSQDREVEFFVLKNDVDAVIQNMILDANTSSKMSMIPDLGSMSCEMMASYIGTILIESQFFGYNVKAVQVYEDWENGARVEFTKLIGE